MQAQLDQQQQGAQQGEMSEQETEENGNLNF